MKPDDKSSSFDHELADQSVVFAPAQQRPRSSLVPSSADAFKDENKVTNSLKSLQHVTERLRGPSLDARMAELGMTLNQLRFSGDKLYGRDRERKLLQQGLERAVCAENHQTEIILLSGYPGTGKSSLAFQLEESVVRHGGCFCAGKYDLMRDRSSLPYSAIAKALTGLVQKISERREEKETDERFEQFQTNLESAIGPEEARPDGALRSIIPNLHLLFSVGEKEKAENSKKRVGKASSVGSTQEKAKLLFLLRQLIRIICEAFCPVVVLLDDLQWIDTASIELLHSLSMDQDIQGLLLLGCYRDNDVGEDHRLSAFLEELSPTSGTQEAPVRVTFIKVANLDEAAIHDMLVDLLQTSSDSPETQALARILQERTFGNVFFVIHFLKALQEMKLLTYNLALCQWQWDNAEIDSRMNVTDNVADLMRLELKAQLPVDARIALQIAACLGNESEESILVVVIAKMREAGQDGGLDWEALKVTVDEVKDWLDQCVKGGFLYRHGTSAFKYRFVHDAIQEAAISFIEEEKLELVQFRIGQTLFENLPSDVVERNLFVAVNFVNHGTKLKCLEQNRAFLIDLNLRAGKKALKASAFGAAAQYLEFGISLLGHDCWEDKNYASSLDLFSTAAQAEYCNGNVEQSRAYIEQVLSQAHSPIEGKLPAYVTLIESYNMQEQQARALSTNLAVLKQLGVHFGPEGLLPLATLRSLQQSKSLLRDMDAADLLKLPMMTDTTKLLAMKMMDIALNACYMLNSPYFGVIEFKMVRWSVKYGVCPESAVAFAVYGLLLAGSFGELERARVMGNVADALSQRADFQETRSRILMQTRAYVFHWTSPIQSCLKPLLLGYEIGMKSGDLENAFYSAYLYEKFSICAGRSLDLVQQDMAEFTTQMKIYSQETIYKMCLPHWQFVLLMRGKSPPSPPMLTGDIMQYDEMMQHLLETNHAYLQDVVRMNQLQLAFYFGDYHLAWRMVEASKIFEKTNMSHLTVWRRVFFIGITAFSLAWSTKRNGAWKRRGKQTISRLKKWVVGGNVNCVHLLHLLLAEERALDEKSQDAAISLFEKAIATASRAGLVHDRALAAERTAEYLCRRNGNNDSSRARDNFQIAADSYREWGALAKVDQLEQRWFRAYSTPHLACS